MDLVRLVNKKGAGEMPTLDYEVSLSKSKRLAIKTAKDLFYGPAVIESIKKAESERRITYILNKARHDVMDQDRNRKKRVS